VNSKPPNPSLVVLNPLPDCCPVLRLAVSGTAADGNAAEGSSAISSILGGTNGNVPKNESAMEVAVTGRDWGGGRVFWVCLNDGGVLDGVIPIAA